MIEDVNSHNYLKVIDFLTESKMITKIQKNLVLNGSVIINNDKIVGIASYEKSKSNKQHAIMRYFIFKKHVTKNEISELLEYTKEKLKEINITKLMGIVTSNDVLKILLDYGFYEVESKYVFIDEASPNKKIMTIAVDIWFDNPLTKNYNIAI